MIDVNTYSLSLSGLQISYTRGNASHRLQLAPGQAAKLMEELKLKHDRWAWEEVVKIFAIDTRLPRVIATYYSNRKYSSYLEE